MTEKQAGQPAGTSRLLVFIFLLGLVPASPVCLAASNLWQHLEQGGRSLDIMGMEEMDDHIVLVGTKYVEEIWQPSENSGSSVKPSMVRKQLYILRIDSDEMVDWQHEYPALPDAQEIFSIAKSNPQRLCIVYGEQLGNEQALTPVLLQINNTGKIIWATREVLANPASRPLSQPEVEQIANLDTLKVAGTPNDGCLLAYVTRHLTAEDETFVLNLIHFDANGSELWRKNIATRLYGKSFLIYDQDARQYIVVQTNQSRDAAIQAMVSAEPFRPQTAITAVDIQGKVLYQHENLPGLKKIWVNDVSDAKGNSILLVGKSTSAWAGHVNSEGKVLDVYDTPKGEFDAAVVTPSGGFAFTRGKFLSLTDEKLLEKSNQKMSLITTMQYINRYLSARLPEDLPAQQILALQNNDFLVLFKLGSKLLKLHVENP